MVDKGESPGAVITFYSYKGGAGRTMAAANLACLLASRVSPAGHRVLLLDWDLEAPGLHLFFSEAVRSPSDKRPGLIDYFHRLSSVFDEDTTLDARLAQSEDASPLEEVLPLREYVISDVSPGVDLLKAGRFNAGYASRVNTFDWAGFYEKRRDVLDSFRRLLTSRYLYCLIDSRTGVTDISGISTTILAEKVIAVFTPNRQSLEGVLEFTRKAVEYRRSSNDFRPLVVFPVPSRIDLAEQSLRQAWRETYQREFQQLFKEIYALPECDLTTYFDDVQLPYVSYYAYGESLAVKVERDEAISLRRAYETVLRRVIDLESPWADPSSLEAGAPSLSVRTQDGVASAFQSAVSLLQANQVSPVRLRFDELTRDILDTWSRLKPSIASQPDSGPQAIRLLIEASQGIGGTTLAIVRLDIDLAFPDWKRLIETMLRVSRRDQGYETLLSVPGATAGFLYMAACVTALHWGSWKIIKKLLRDKFEWYYQSGRPLYDFGFHLVPFFHPEALRRDSAKVHDLFRTVLSEPSYASLLNLDAEMLLNIYLQTQLLHCLRSAQEVEQRPEAGAGPPFEKGIWADFGRFHDFRVIPLLDRVHNDSEYASGLCAAFDESPREWLNKLNPRLAFIRSTYFEGAQYLWDSIQNYNPRH